ncbi:MAG: hypothetical protein ACFFKA_19340, partial [Candidatus Thorarchaeota archaeon]
IADGHKINKIQHRKGRAQVIDQKALSSTIAHVEGLYYGSYIRILDDWLNAIKKKQRPLLHAKVAANFCLSGIQASRSARDGGKPKEIKIYTN